MMGQFRVSWIPIPSVVIHKVLHDFTNSMDGSAFARNSCWLSFTEPVKVKLGNASQTLMTLNPLESLMLVLSCFNISVSIGMRGSLNHTISSALTICIPKKHKYI